MRTASSTPGMNDDRSYESWRIVSVSPGRAEDDLLVRDHAPHPHRVHPDRVVDEPAARALGDRVEGRVRGPLLRSRRHPVRGEHRGARRRVDLLVVVQLDDLGRLEPRRGLLGEPHHEDRTDREVRGDERVRRAVSEELRELVEVVLGEAGRADHRVHVVRGTPAQVLAGRVDHGEVDAHVGGAASIVSGRRGDRQLGAGDRLAPRARGSTAATSSQSDAPSTAAHTVAPMRPPAPNTPTRITRRD